MEIDGRTEWGLFNADGPQATFNEAKGRLAVFGPHSDSVLFTRRATVHGERSQVVTGSAVFFPERNDLKLDGLTGADGLP